jgi:hypothetical protein
MPTATARDAPVVRQIDDVLRVKFVSSEIDWETGQTLFGGGVEATYGPTVVRCERLIIDSKGSKGRAIGQVVLTDPEGRLEARDLEFDWLAKTGSATGVLVQIGTVRIETESISVEPETWTLGRSTGFLARASRPPVAFQARSVTLRPGRHGVARQVYLLAYGARLGPVASVPFSLRKRVKGIGLPSVANRKGAGLGVSWDGQLPLGDHGSLSAFWNTFPKRPNAFGAELAYSPLDPESGTLIVPGSELSERAGDGWFNNVAVRSPCQESSDLKASRASFSLGSVWNQGAIARRSAVQTVSKALDLSAEFGGFRLGWGGKGLFKFQSVRDSSQAPFLSRALAQFTLKPPDMTLGRGLRAVARCDVFGTFSERGQFGWARLETGVVFGPQGPWTLGAAWVVGRSSGAPDFSFDRLYSERAVHLRADWVSGPYTARYLAKYDFDRMLWYDREYEIAVVANVFEPYVLVRDFPSDTRFGIRFRLDGLGDKLKERNRSR